MIEFLLTLSCKSCRKDSLIENQKGKYKNSIFKFYKRISHKNWEYILECPHCQRTNKYSKFSFRFTYMKLLIGAVIGLVLAITLT